MKRFIRKCYERKMTAVSVCLLSVFLMLVSCGFKEKTGIEVKKENRDEQVQPAEVSSQQVTASGEEAGDASTELDKEADDADAMEEKASIVVYVCGAVQSPGVYTLSGNSRMTDAVEAAGGMTQEADKNVLNLAQLITDGQMIRIPVIGEVSEEDWLEQQSSSTLEEKSGTDLSSGKTEAKVNINTASVQELMTIPGIGQTKAEAIVSYRKEHGSFAKIEDIMQISGIKEGSFAKMEPYICVK